MFVKKKVLMPTFILFLLLSAVACVAEERSKFNRLGTVPLLISDYMKTIDCSPIDNFYSNYMIERPPFVWLDGSSFVFVCESENPDSEINYELVVKDNVRQGFFKSCPATISLLAKPGGLALENRTIEKDDFASIGKHAPLKSAPQKELPILVLSTGTGGYIEYVCISGNWYFNTYS